MNIALHYTEDSIWFSNEILFKYFFVKWGKRNHVVDSGWTTENLKEIKIAETENRIVYLK